MTPRKLYIFNPDHDLALANGDVNYIPPAAARQFSADMAVFPAWYAEENSYILASTTYNKSFLDDKHQLFPSLPTLVTEPEIIKKDYSPMPWGWNPALCKKLAHLGISPDNLPTTPLLDAIRKASHRKMALDLVSKLTINPNYCGCPVYLTDKEDIRSFVLSHNPCILKAPLSGSGKGLNWCKGQFTAHMEHWCANILKQQGGVIAEPLYRKVLDFSMQFRTNPTGELNFTGYSLFQTNSSGAYIGNLLLTDSGIETRLTRYVPGEFLKTVRNIILKELKGAFAGIYTSYFGVDMMICEFNDEPRYRIHPCVEINLRMNMGMASRLFYDKYVDSGATGMLKVCYYPSPEALQKEISVLEKKHPLSCRNNKIHAGYFPLIPVTAFSRYHAWIQINT